jgi:hypothetical protein
VTNQVCLQLQISTENFWVEDMSEKSRGHAQMTISFAAGGAIATQEV